MTSTSTRNLSALRASIKHEDAALESRLPAPKAGATSKTTNAAAPAKPTTPTKPTATKPVQRKTPVTAPAQPKAAAATATTKPIAVKVPTKPANTKAVAKPRAATAGAKPAAPKAAKPVVARASTRSATTPKPTPRPAPTRTEGAAASKPGAVGTQAMKVTAGKLTKQKAGDVQGKASKPVSGKKPKADKLEKDSVELLQSEWAQIKSLRTRLEAGGVNCTRSGVLRAGLAALLKLDAAAQGTLAQAFAKAPKSKGSKKG